MVEHDEVAVIGVVTAVVASLLGSVVLLTPEPLRAVRTPAVPPPPGGYLQLRPAGDYARLPDDQEAARMVHRSAWEIRPENLRYNETRPSPGVRMALKDPAQRAYDPRWNEHVLGRITGDFTGTTDEVFQWAAAKWGLPDETLRVVGLMESAWRQDNAGDVVDDPRACPPGYEAPCPVTFGIVGTKSTSWEGIFPWNRDSTAAAVDVLGAWLRGCFEGWVWWLRDHGNRSEGVYGPGDLWGCVGAWFSGDWYDREGGRKSGAGYVERARGMAATRPWLRNGY